MLFVDSVESRKEASGPEQSQMRCCREILIGAYEYSCCKNLININGKDYAQGEASPSPSAVVRAFEVEEKITVSPWREKKQEEILISFACAAIRQ